MQAANDVRPFAGLHYDQRAVGSIGDCLTQPYDVISPSQQEDYYRRHPRNVIRLILNRGAPDNGAPDNRYARAAGHLAEWKAAGVLRLRKEPAFWVYEQRYSLPWNGTELATHGFIGTVRLQDFDAGAILPHEKVMSGPIRDRLRLTSATHTQFESIWGFYHRPSSAAEVELKKTMAGVPAINYSEPPASAGFAHVRHRLWCMDDPAACETVGRAVSAAPIYIADGHHRYQTMLGYRDTMRRKRPAAGSQAPWEFIMMYLVNAAASELTILPYHRLIHGLESFRGDALLGRLEKRFALRRYSPDREEAFLRDLEKSSGPAFGALLAGSTAPLLLTLREPGRHAAGKAGRASELHSLLDVNVLNELILNDALGISEERIARKSNIDYFDNPAEVMARVRGGRADIGLLLRAPSLETVMKLSELGEVLPRKSTYFYPKPLSGLVFYPMDAESEAPGPGNPL